jgi:glycosyltransferase involved in cell wall biosynthesis
MINYFNNSNIHPTIDVIIPAYNASTYIKETINSVLQQSLLPSRIIVIDDGSTDRTVEIVKTIESNLITLIKVKNGGVSRARNVGIAASKADFIAFLDADDLWMPEKLEKQIKALEASKSAGIAYTGTSLIDAEGKDIPNSTGEPYIEGNVFTDILFYERPIYGSASSVMVKRKILDFSGYFDEHLNYSEDVDLWVRLAAISQFTFTSDVLVKIRQHNQSATRQHNKNRKVEILAQHLLYLNKWAGKLELPQHLIELQLKRIILLFLDKNYRFGDLLKFIERVQKDSPYLAKSFGKNTFHILLRMIYIILKSLPGRIFRKLKLRDRVSLLFREKKVFFRHASEFNPEAEAMRKRK